MLSRDRYLTSLILWTDARTAMHGATVFRYLFTHPVPVSGGTSFGAFHTGEVPYLFGNLDPSARPYGAADRRVTAMVQDYWLNFARTGNPNGPRLPAWSQVDPGSSTVFAIGESPEMRTVVSSPARFEALRAYAEQGGTLSMF